ncbi:unnamed protein product [Phytomonas sp. Hart1]|nr:unnamed protein product [Phytomonas sp. Hart1]|eukprot:CCW71692.1 unnamed protein product [Phytomonas sp. isolate Hart1]
MFNGIPRTLTGYYTAAPAPQIHSQLRRQLSPLRERLLTRLSPPPAFTLRGKKGKEVERAFLVANENERRNDITAGRSSDGSGLSRVGERKGSIQLGKGLSDVPSNQPEPTPRISGRDGHHGKGFLSLPQQINSIPSSQSAVETGVGEETMVKEKERWSCCSFERQPVEPAENDEYDTVERIARHYGITVGEVLSWNPSLSDYRPDEPLPSSMPIVLFIPDDEGEEPRESISPMPMKP